MLRCATSHRDSLALDPFGEVAAYLQGHHHSLDRLASQPLVLPKFQQSTRHTITGSRAPDLHVSTGTHRPGAGALYGFCRGNALSIRIGHAPVV